MVFDPGTNTFAWGQLFGTGGGRPMQQGRSNYGGIGQMPRAGMPSYNWGSGSYGADQFGIGNAYAQSLGTQTALGQQEDLWKQQLQERTLGLQHKYGMDQLNAQLEAQKWQQMMQMYAQGMALPTGEQIERSRGDLAPSRANFQRYADQGQYDDAEMNTLSQNAWNQINEGALGSARTMNNQLSSMGLSANPGAAQALGMAGKFAANAQRGGVMADLIRQNEEAKRFGVSGLAGIDSQLADYASRPVNRMANFNPWEMMMDQDQQNKRKKAAGQDPSMAYGQGSPWQPKVTGSY
jgi:hypothetical protein